MEVPFGVVLAILQHRVIGGAVNVISKLPTDKLYVIIHSKLVPEFDVTGPEKIFILGRTISAAVKAGAQAGLASREELGWT